MRFLKFALLPLLAVLSTPHDINAATVELLPVEGESVSLIAVDGPLEFGDSEKFINLAIATRTGIVVLNSPGGNLLAGIEIGRAIRLKGFPTVVPEGFSCSSACALAWLGGRRRLMAPGATIGFHAASTNSGAVSPAANAIVGAYLNELGLSMAAIAYITETQPQTIKRLTFTDAVRYGIDVEPFRVSTTTETASSKLDESKPREDWTTYGAWVQAYSRPSYNEAMQLASSLRVQQPDTFVFLYDNGWYAVVVRPFAAGQAKAWRDKAIAAGTIPQDSFVVRGQRFAALIGTDRPSANRTISSEGEATRRAVRVVTEFFRLTSATGEATMRGLERFYPSEVVYFGKRLAKADVIKDKRDFVARWPERSYIPRPQSIHATCTAINTCRVTGIVDWKAYSPDRDSSSVGVATFDITVLLAGEVQILAESSEVSSREVFSGRAD